MKNKKILVWGGIIALLLIIVFWITSIINTEVKLDKGADKAEADVQAQYQRRFDVYPKLINSIEQAAKQEQEILIEVTRARALVKQGQNADSREESDRAAAGLRAVASNLMGYQEKYPEVASLGLFRDFNIAVEGTENRIAKARKNYNEAVEKYNIHISKFPNSMFLGSKKEKESFKASEEAQDSPDIEINVGRKDD